MKASAALLLAATALLVGCAAQKPAATRTALELQAIQSKEFECTKQQAFAAALSVFQDLGYVVSTASLDTGLITAKSPTRQSFVVWAFRMRDRKATAFVEDVGKNRARIRLNFVESTQTSGAYGYRSEDDTPIESPELYQETFQKIQHAIFIRKTLE